MLAALLRQLDVPRERIDATLLTQRRDLLRRELAGRPAVIVVENVPDGDYLHSLLPKDGLSRVFVTSRRTLTAPDSGSAGGTGGDSGTGSAGAVPLSVQLGPLSPSDGLTLLAKRVGVDRIRQERAQSERLVELTGGIALDLTVVASAVVNHADWSLADHVYRLEGTSPGRTSSSCWPITLLTWTPSGRSTRSATCSNGSVGWRRPWPAIARRRPWPAAAGIS